MDIGAYLERIGYSGERRPSFDVLSALQRAHVCSVTFENLDVQLGTPLTIDVDAAYDKIVERRRGGWCYEQNGLFGWALAELGFAVTRVAASVLRAERGDIAEANHLCLLVRCDDSRETWLADVGFGGSLIEPLPLQRSTAEHTPFWLGLRQLTDGWWQFWEDIGKGEFTYDFETQPADEAALELRCRFLQTDPSSGFVQTLVAQRRKPDQHLTVRGRVFSVASRNGIESRILESADELVTLLDNEFDLDVDGVADLWPRILERHEEHMRESAANDTYEIRSGSHGKKRLH